MKYFSAFVFDLDDTLHDYKSANEAGYDALQKFLNVDKSKFKACAEVAKRNFQRVLSPSSHNRLLYFQILAEKLGRKDPIFSSLQFYNVYEEAYLANCKLFPWVKKTLEYLSSRGFTLAICTNQTAFSQFNVITKLGIGGYFKTVITSEQVGTEKPNTPIYDFVKTRLNLKSEKICFVGDNYDCDYHGPKANGMNAKLLSDFNCEDFLNEYCGRKIWA